MAGRPLDPVADQRIEGGPDGQRQVMTEAEIGQRHADDRVDRPSMNPPMEKGNPHRLAGRRDRTPLAARRALPMHDRLGDTVEHQPDAHAGAEQHGEPCQVVVVGLRIVRPQFDLPHRTGGHADGENQECRDRQHVEPAEGLDDPVLDGAENLSCSVGRERAKKNESDDQNRRSEKNRWIDMRRFGLPAVL